MENFRVPNSLIKRRVTEKIDPSSYRTEFTRDRDRVLYATAFRRLAGKTQIYTVGNDDHKRNRMTHTLEVAQISRTIAKALDLDEYLAEAIALGHDFGHTPFGHAGEEMLHAIMIPNSSYVKNSPYANDHKYIENLVERECEENKAILDYAYGFKHNIQSLRVATSLEDSYRDEKRNNAGLDLTNVTLYGMMVHSKLEYKNSEQQPNYQDECRDLWSYNVEDEIPAWSFEAYVVKWADEIAQWHHDLEDALRGKALPKKTIVKTIKVLLNDKLDEFDNHLLATVEEKDYVDRNVLASLAHIIVNFFVNDIINESKKNFEILRNECGRKKFDKDEDFFLKYDEYKFSISKEKVVAFSPSVSPDSPDGIAVSFEKTIKEAVHHSKNVERMNAKGAYIIRKLFQAYFSHPQQLPDGPILHLMVECNEYVNKACNNNKVMSGNYTNIDTAKSEGIGKVRFDFDMLLKNPNIYVQIHLMRRICDHIASMTDHYAIEEYTNLYG